MSFRTMAATSVCSDGRSHCRLKVRITTNIDSIDIPKVIWSSVAFEIQPNVRDFCQKLCTNLGLGGRQAEIYMHDVLIPNWEVCSFIFKDGDELEYVRKCFKLKVYDTTVRDTNPPNEDHSVALNDCETKRKRKKRKKDLSSPTPTPHQAPKDGFPDTKPIADVKASNDAVCSGLPSNNQGLRISNDHEESEATEVSEREEMTPMTRRDRSKALTPIEIELVKEMESLPKPKRKKHRRRKSGRAELSSSIAENSTISTPKDVEPLNCNFQGSKTVFDSETEETEDGVLTAVVAELPVPVDSVPEVHKIAEVPDSLSCVDVKPLRKNLPIANGNDFDKTHGNPSPVLTTSNTANNQRSPAARRYKTGPAIYKRERLKLRATISPAIHSEIIRSQAQLCPDLESHTDLTSENTTPKISQVPQRVSTENGTASDAGSITATNYYSRFPKLAGPPRLNDRIAFKVLEVSEDYTPGVSDFKEATVMAYDAESDLAQIKLLSQPRERSFGGIFDVCIEDDSGTLTNISERQDQMVEKLSSLIDVRLMDDISIANSGSHDPSRR